jgi:DNA-binding transcriptional MerR regulator
VTAAQEIHHTKAGFRVEELSARTGAPVRTIREYQTWQILHPPTRAGRVGLYDESHVRRLEGIARLQARGYSIAAIRDLFDAWEQGVGLRDVLGLDDTIGLAGDEAPLALTSAQLERLIPSICSSKRLLARACAIGLIFEHGDGYIARSPALLQVVADAIQAGLSPTSALDLASAVVSSARQAAEAAATAVIAGAETGLDNVEPLVRRGRVLLARAIATHTIDQVGRELATQASSIPELSDLLADIRIGTIVTSPSSTDTPRRAT